MNEIREMINISYFDNKNTTLKEHCDIYSNIKKEVLDILNKYDIKYVVAETEVIKDLSKENQELKKQLEKKYEKVGTLTGELLYEENTKLINQQKEFIEWLEAKIKNYELPLTDENKKALGYTLPMKGIYKEILSKYKEIIGGKHE